MTELKPCPFCGGEAEIDEFPFSIFCMSCFAETKGCQSVKEAIEAWNRRVSDVNSD